MRSFAKFGLAMLIVLAATTGGAWAIDPADIYAGRTIVTGTLEPERGKGLRRIMLDVLIKAAAEPRLADDPRVPALLERATDYVIGFEYEDRMKGTPVRDEQGTRDRPHDLTASFDAAKIDAALGKLGLKPWKARRPTVTAFVVVRYPANAFMLSAEGEDGLAQKQALADAARRRGLQIVLPPRRIYADYETRVLRGERPTTLATATYDGAFATLEGEMHWQETDAFWRTTWWVYSERGSRSWSIDSPSFDEAFRNGVGEAAATLAGRR